MQHPSTAISPLDCLGLRIEKADVVLGIADDGIRHQRARKLLIDFLFRSPN
jgi:hypothetical protein